MNSRIPPNSSFPLNVTQDVSFRWQEVICLLVPFLVCLLAVCVHRAYQYWRPSLNSQIHDSTNTATFLVRVSCVVRFSFPVISVIEKALFFGSGLLQPSNRSANPHDTDFRLAVPEAQSVKQVITSGGPHDQPSGIPNPSRRGFHTDTSHCWLNRLWHPSASRLFQCRHRLSPRCATIGNQRCAAQI